MKEYLQEMSDVYSRAEPTDADGEMAPSIYVEEGDSGFGWVVTCGCETLLEALEIEKAKAVVLQGKTIFIRSGELRNGEWYYVEQD